MSMSEKRKKKHNYLKKTLRVNSIKKKEKNEFKIFDSLLIPSNQQNIKNKNYKIFDNNSGNNNYIAKSQKTLIDQIIGKKIDNTRNNFFIDNYETKTNRNNNIKNMKNFSKTNYNFYSILSKNNTMKIKTPNKHFLIDNNTPFVTSIDFKNIQTNEESKTLSPKLKLQKNNLASFGNSLNRILINSINNAIMNKGNIIDKKRQNISINNYDRNKSRNFNNYEIHKKIFDDKLIEIFRDFHHKMKLCKKERLYNLIPDLEEKKKITNSRIPLSIKGYKKNDIDIFYTRNICDLDYEKYYKKEKINMNDILHYHNKYNRKDYLSGKVPFFMLTKTVVKPNCKKSKSQKTISGNIFSNIEI